MTFLFLHNVDGVSAAECCSCVYVVYALVRMWSLSVIMYVCVVSAPGFDPEVEGSRKTHK